ncbi:MAG TPA: glucodextranase DOMON-like domain-containing protein, partial [Candidatus Ozemobacteraceae bacterium]|nr:glucodextranase DOMON-like domain-containing protein [Candidatus Ozemobacteraceae bacterium]
KMILVTPLSQFRAYDVIKNKTEEIGFQDMVPDIIIPDYVQVQRDKIILRISKSLLVGKPSPDWGFQCLVMGYSNVVSPNRLLNMDVKAFATPKDFGGGWDTYGDPPVIDMIVPGDIEDADRRQYALLKAYRSEPYRGEIEYAMIPFVYGREKPSAATGGNAKQDLKLLTQPPTVLAPAIDDQPPSILPADASPAAAKPPVTAPAARTSRGPAGITSSGMKKPAAGTISDSSDAGFLPIGKAGSADADVKSGFLPIRKAVPGAGTSNSGTATTASSSFQPLKKKTGSSTGFMPIRKAAPTIGD